MDKGGAEFEKLVEQLIARQGDAAYSYAREQAERAKDNGDRESAMVWSDVALAVLEMSNERAAAQ